MSQKRPLTPDQFKADLRQKGITVTEWASKRGYKRRDVYRVLNGQLKAHFGRAHEIAVAIVMKSRSAANLELFEVPRPPAPLPGSMDYRTLVCELTSSMLGGLNRHEVACEMSRLTGRDVSKSMLDSYCAPSHDNYNLPAWAVPALETATRSYDFSNWLATVRGGQLLVGVEVLDAAIGKAKHERDIADALIKQLSAQRKGMK
ncbi:hypothetical protein RF55_22026 [Lasius niger]|uniref:Uncharacterized protein n=1 Tax=Lasius niger TaxID=67767 RepID=A0A0J7JXE8_LASNI|nr:hypothetical protein RF55_22026 [Lasius niger]